MRGALDIATTPSPVYPARENGSIATAIDGLRSVREPLRCVWLSGARSARRANKRPILLLSAQRSEPMHMRRIALSVLSGALLATLGCSAGSAVSMFQNSQRTDSYLKVWLDGQLATQDQFKKTVGGYARFTIDTPVSTTPTLKFEIM